MAVRGFFPPEVELTPELEWVLVRAFANPLQTTRRVNSERAASLAAQLALSERISRRIAQDQLNDELGGEGARALAFHRLAAEAADRFIQSALREVVSAAKSAPVVALKHAALRASGAVAAGQRDARDLDVLVNFGNAEALSKRLHASGYETASYSARPHHGPALRSPAGAVVEIHTAAPGMTLPGGGPLTASALVSRGARLAQEGFWVPPRTFLLAHALVHGLVQHANSPEDYPLMRMLADLCDLELEDEDVASVVGWMATLGRDETEAASELVECLVSGALPEGESAADVLLRHVVGAACDPSYQRLLRLRRVTALGRSRHWLPALRRVFLPTRADLELHYGPLSTTRDFLWRRTLHPLRRATALTSDALRAARARLWRAR